MIRFHSIILIICSIIGFSGHYIQFGVARLTPWIPAAAGIFILFLNHTLKKKTGLLKYMSIILVLVFGIITTSMCINFLPQEFQPLRKKIIFSLMSVSAWVTVIHSLGTMLKVINE